MNKIHSYQFEAPCDFVVNSPLYQYSSFISDEKKSMATFLGMEFDKQILLIIENSSLTEENFTDYVANTDPNITLIFVPEQYIEEFLSEVETEVNYWNNQKKNNFGYFDNGSLVFGMKKTKDGLVVLMVDEAICHDLEDMPYIKGIHKINAYNSDEKLDSKSLLFCTIEESNLYSYTKEDFWEQLKEDGMNKKLVDFCQQQFEQN